MNLLPILPKLTHDEVCQIYFWMERPFRYWVDPYIKKEISHAHVALYNFSKVLVVGAKYCSEFSYPEASKTHPTLVKLQALFNEMGKLPNSPQHPLRNKRAKHKAGRDQR